MFRSTPHPFSLRRRLPLRLEMLERREVPAVFQVTNLNDSGAGSLRAAINEANNSSDADEIKIEVIGTLALTSGEMEINNDVTIIGPGSGSFTIDAEDNDSGRIFDIGTEGRVHASISGMTLTNGNGGDTGRAIRTFYGPNLVNLSDVVISNCTGGRGAAIDLSSGDSLVMDNCVLTGNSSQFDRGGAVFLAEGATGQFRNSTISGNQAEGSGGGIYAADNAVVTVERCTISGNRALPSKGPSNGGGLFVANGVSLNIQETTFSGNSASRSGGGIYISGGFNSDGASFTINNSTISGNTAGIDGGGIFIGQDQTPSRPAGGGYYFANPHEILHCTITGNVSLIFDTGGGVFTLRDIDVANSIIAGNTATPGPDVFTGNDSTIELSFSLIGDPSDATISDNGGNIFDTDPLLGPLANNGGPTRTHALLENSPAIDAGDPAFQTPPFSPVYDQRGANFGRVVFGTTDMGAYEVQGNEPPPEVTRFLHAVGAGAGTTAQVKVFDESNNLVCVFDAYPTFPVGARVAVADMDADGIEDVITSPGPGGGPHVQVFSGAKLLNGVAERIVSSIGSFFSYDPFWLGGVFVGTGDVNGDGRVDIITGADASGGPHVVAWDNLTGDAIVSFYAYDANFRGGVRVAGGDLNGDGVSEIITGAGPGGGPHVRAFNSTGAVVHELFAYDANFLGGVYVAAGDINGDGDDDIITGAGEGGGPHTRVFSGTDLAVLRDFFAYDVNWKGGVRVGSFDFNHDGRDDIITGAGPTGGPHAIAYSGLDNSILASAYVWELPFPFGIYVA